ncbi:MAG: hypothetical protein BZ138_07645 [Methanosphaera sp. rholeuAM270]|nr:MAG: hypothetical protein BZ138_07645 [Methanosphaera sp. rholeuAM270]
MCTEVITSMYSHSLFPSGSLSPEVVGALSFGMLGEDEIPAQMPYADDEMGEQLSSLTERCQMMSILRPREKYASLPEWYDSAKRAREICDIWIDAVKGSGLALSSTFPLGVDADALAALGEMLGVDSKIRAYLAGVPVTDLVTGDPDTDFF